MIDPSEEHDPTAAPPQRMLAGPTAWARALAPGVVLVAFAFGGGFYSGASSRIWLLWAALAAAILVLAARVPARSLWPVMIAAAVAVWVSLLESDIPEVGVSAAGLLPLLFLVPGLVPLETSERRVAVRGLLVGGAVVAGWALVDAAVATYQTGELQRAAMPLGHHNLLAFWLLPLLVLAAGHLLEKEGRQRLAALFAVVLSAGALVASGSLAGLVGVGVGLCALAGWGGRARSRPKRGLLLGGALVVVLAAPRLFAIAQGSDLSTRLRWGYMQAAWAGFQDAPWTGHGPGVGSMSLAEYHRPRLGVNPAGEILSDAHSLPLDLLFELGSLGALLLVLVVIWLIRERPGPAAGSTRHAAWAAMVGWLAMSSVAGTFDVAALAFPPLICMGLISDAAPHSRRTRWAVVVVVAMAAAWVYPVARSHFFWDVESADGPAKALSGHSLPLYEIYTASTDHLPPERTHLSAFLLARAAGGSCSDARRACQVDPVSAWPPFLIARQSAGGEPCASSQDHSIVLQARAAALQPEFLAAEDLADPVRLRDIRAELEHDPRLPLGWRAAWVDQIDRVLEAAEPAQPQRGWALLELDYQPNTAVALFSFRRRPRPLTLLEVPLRAHVLELIDLPPLSAVAGEVDEGFLDPEVCRVPARPAALSPDRAAWKETLPGN